MHAVIGRSFKSGKGWWEFKLSKDVAGDESVCLGFTSLPVSKGQCIMINDVQYWNVSSYDYNIFSLLNSVTGLCSGFPDCVS